MKLLCFVLIFLLVSCQSNKYAPKGQKSETKSGTESIILSEKERLLGEATTKILDKGENRVTNIRLACNSISGKILLPGEIFSFNDLTGARSVENGYKSAPVLIEGETSYGIGGGVCQVSSTIYMAALNAELDIIERHRHSENVAYTTANMDATVVFDEKDLKLKNNTSNAISIYTWVENDIVYAKILSANN